MTNLYFKPSFLLRRLVRHCKCAYYEQQIYYELFNPYLFISYSVGSFASIGFLYSFFFFEKCQSISIGYILASVIPIISLGFKYSFRVFLSNCIIYLIFILSYLNLLGSFVCWSHSLWGF